MSTTLSLGDCRKILARLTWQVDAVVCDPPYELAFMGKGWDSAGVSFDSKTWAAILRVMKPGAFLLAFGGARTYHRIACAIEDAGFEIRDCLSWLYGTGFPKSLNVGNGQGTALKPAWEPIILARKPLIGTVAANVAKHGTGALQIDACRLERAPDDASGWSQPGSKESENTAMAGKNYARDAKPDASGRWPANVCLDEDAAEMLDAQSGVLRSGDRATGVRKGLGYNSTAQGDGGPAIVGSSGGASRFFYCAKASRSERGKDNKHPTVKPIALMQWLVRLVTPPDGIVLDPFMGSGTTGIACLKEDRRFFGIEQEQDYFKIAKARIK